MRPRDVLESFGVRAAGVRLRSKGSRNWHWMVRGPDGDLVLTRFFHHRSLDDARYQARVMRRFRERGWPVPEVLGEPVVVGERVWMLSRRAPGRQRTARAERSIVRDHREIGRLIARFHADAWDVVDLGQRPGFLRADEFATLRPTHEEVLAAWESKLPEEVGLLRWHWERSRQLLDSLGCATLPPIVIHGDMVPWNLLYQDDRLSGLLDFEFSHLDVRVGEFALSWRGKYDELIEAYLGETPLDDREIALITPVRWAWLVDGARFALLHAGDREPDLSWTMPQLLRRTALMDSSF